MITPILPTAFIVIGHEKAAANVATERPSYREVLENINPPPLGRFSDND